MNNTNITTIAFLLGCTVFPAGANNVLSLDQAVALAQQNDPWLHGSELKQHAVENLSIASGTLPDPKVSISMMNLPVDGFNLNQEAMTQFKLGMSQTFPRGETLAIKRSKLKAESAKYPLLREDRKAKLKSLVSQLWLDAYLAQQTIVLIEKDRALFEQMAEVAKASYSSAVGKTRQQDVIRAQLEIIQLEDRLASQTQKYEMSLAQLNEWLHVFDDSNLDKAFSYEQSPLSFSVSAELPSIDIQSPATLDLAQYSRSAVAKSLSGHPAIQAIAVKHQVSQQQIALTKQQYKSQWGVNASYSYRDDMPSGQTRADLFSVGVTFDLPLFTENKQDREVAAAQATAEAVKTEKLLLTKKMLSGLEKELRQLKRLADRQAIYHQQLLSQTHEQAEASLTAYTNDDGDFAEVVRARIAELNARIAALKINVDALKTIARINYLFARTGQGLKPVHDTNS